MSAANNVNEFLEWALKYAALGFRVVPITPEAKAPPLIADWTRRASTDPAQIRQWWTKWPNANIGLMPREGEICVDIDPRNGGDPALLQLPTNTPTQRTGGGGWHYIVRVDPDAILPKLPGVDYKLPGKGYFLAEPSIHPDTGAVYAWGPSKEGETRH